MKRSSVLGAEIDLVGFDEAIDRAMDAMNGRTGRFVITPNAEFLLKVGARRELREASRQAFLSLPDSIGIVCAAKIQGSASLERIPGIDFAQTLLGKMSEKGKSVFLFGAKEGVAEKAAERLCRQYPGLVIAGVKSGYFSAEDEEQICRQISAASPDLLIVCLGCPKQELWMLRNAPRLSAGLMAGLGGALDVFAGIARRAPERWRKAGLEWLYRILIEPKRILRVMRIPFIIPISLWYRIGGKK